MMVLVSFSVFSGVMDISGATENRFNGFNGFKS